jgi:hypothetical protein
LSAETVEHNDDEDKTSNDESAHQQNDELLCFLEVISSLLGLLRESRIIMKEATVLLRLTFYKDNEMNNDRYLCCMR